MGLQKVGGGSTSAREGGHQPLQTTTGGGAGFGNRFIRGSCLLTPKSQKEKQGRGRNAGPFVRDVRG